MNEVMGETTLRIPYAEHARHGCHFMNAFVLLALFRPQAGKEVSGFNFLYLIVYIHQKYRIYIYLCILRTSRTQHERHPSVDKHVW